MIFVLFVYLHTAMTKAEYINGFSSYIFWDADSKTIDPEINAPYIVQRVLEYGQIGDWRHLLDFYGLSRITDLAKKFRSLEPRALSFISTVSNTPIDQFRCYTLRQSNPEHCNF